jgi:translation elongation factor P/translation initiation factor 5A
MGVASELKRGDSFEYKGEIVRVVRKEVVVFGTHSHSKLKLYVEPVFGGGEKSLTMQHHDKVDVLDIKKKTGQVIAKLPDKLQIMDSHTYETLDAEAKTEVLNEASEGSEVIFVDYGGQAKVLEVVKRVSS